jgi:hypothetical protein
MQAHGLDTSKVILAQQRPQKAQPQRTLEMQNSKFTTCLPKVWGCPFWGRCSDQFGI